MLRKQIARTLDTSRVRPRHAVATIKPHNHAAYSASVVENGSLSHVEIAYSAAEPAVERADAVFGLFELGIRRLTLLGYGWSVCDRQLGRGPLLLSDQINLTGNNPLIDARFESRASTFPDMSAPFACDLPGEPTDGMPSIVYAGVQHMEPVVGPEAEFTRMLGAHVAGPCFVPEVLAAHAIGVDVLAFALQLGAESSPIEGDWRQDDRTAAGPYIAAFFQATSLRSRCEPNGK